MLGSRKQLTMKSLWDHFVLPFPFTVITVISTVDAIRVFFFNEHAFMLVTQHASSMREFPKPDRGIFGKPMPIILFQGN